MDDGTAVPPFVALKHARGYRLYTQPILVEHGERIGLMDRHIRQPMRNIYTEKRPKQWIGGGARPADFYDYVPLDVIAEEVRLICLNSRNLSTNEDAVLELGSAAFYGSAPSWCPDWTVSASASCLICREHIPTLPVAVIDSLDGPLYSVDGGLGAVKEPLTPAKASPLCFSINGNNLNPGESGPYSEAFQAAKAMFRGDVPAAWPRDPERPAQLPQPPDNDPYFCDVGRSRFVTQGRRPCISAGGYTALMPEWVLATDDAREPEQHEKGAEPSGRTVGIGQDRTREGLVLAILAGCSVPIILEEVQEQVAQQQDGGTGGQHVRSRADGVEAGDAERYYKFRGTAFVQGWMEGEVLVGKGGCATAREFWDGDWEDKRMLRII
ncbi:hypothetical protein Micbo1qcDRAFT_199273 [Microdochium bolleyi]|uniref:Uncharacterized protein n=1 Tax=Microdochium bolleyi TaxID=196109 RepID=A0A136JH31_9PEZI|nr:hypothetical protein Micbo1qcDRAFT_199273 [Microdochium bolleyi]